MTSALTLMSELEDAVKNRDSKRRLQLLRQITDLFLNDADRLNEEQVGVFDDILSHLALRMEERVRAELSTRVAPVSNAPLNLTKSLANDPNISVAAPVLEHSTRISDEDLIDIARAKSQDHLFAISGRSAISEQLSDVLVGRGDKRVMQRLVHNNGARFSQNGFAALVKNADGDDDFTVMLGSRLDLPFKLLKQLFEKAGNLVRSRLLAASPPERQQEIQSVLAGVSGDLLLETSHEGMESAAKRLNREGKLNEKALVTFIEQRQATDVIETLALFCSVPADVISTLICSTDSHGTLIACKAAKLNWPIASAILQARFSGHAASAEELAEARRTFLQLSDAVAIRTLRFMAVQNAAKESVAASG